MLAFVLLFGGVFAIAKWGSRAMGQRSRASLVGGFDRRLGAGFGAVKGLALATVLFMGATQLHDIAHGNTARPAWMTAHPNQPALNAARQAPSKSISRGHATTTTTERERGGAEVKNQL